MENLEPLTKFSAPSLENDGYLTPKAFLKAFTKTKIVYNRLRCDYNSISHLRTVTSSRELDEHSLSVLEGNLGRVDIPAVLITTRLRQIGRHC